MMRLLTSVLLSGASILHAQSDPSASRLGDLKIGVGYTTAKPGYFQQTFPGVAIYADLDFRQHLGVEAEFHQVNSTNYDKTYERTYEIGGRYFITSGPVVPYVKAMIGRAVLNYPGGQTNRGYDIYAGGVGLDLKLRSRFRIRGEYELQKWTSFRNGGLAPSLVTIALAYRFTGKLDRRN